MKLVRGVGINDANYQVVRYTKNADGTKTREFCPIYRDWDHMLDRCYGSGGYARRECYSGVSVTPEWFSFMDFREWVVSKYEPSDVGNLVLDKDLLQVGSRIYSPKTCSYIPVVINNFIVTRKYNGSLIGARLIPSGWVSCISDPFTKKTKYIGTFKTEIDAHLAWKAEKHLYAERLSVLLDGDAKIALLDRYSPSTDWTVY